VLYHSCAITQAASIIQQNDIDLHMTEQTAWRRPFIVETRSRILE